MKGTFRRGVRSGGLADRGENVCGMTVVPMVLSTGSSAVKRVRAEEKEGGSKEWGGLVDVVDGNKDGVVEVATATPATLSPVKNPGVRSERVGGISRVGWGEGGAVGGVDLVDGGEVGGTIGAVGENIGMAEKWRFLSEFFSVEPDSFVNVSIEAVRSRWDGRHGWGGGGFVVANGGREVDMVGRFVGKRSTKNGRRTDGRCWFDSDQIVSYSLIV